MYCVLVVCIQQRQFFTQCGSYIIDDAYQNAYTKHLDPGMNNLVAIIVPSLLILFDVMCFLYILPFMHHKFPSFRPILGLLRVLFSHIILEGLDGGVLYSLFIKNLAHYSSH